ncbi:MAG: universal stress protein [Proteobacteria bacterium]|nr:universal stress protein [Pseudomonadota bacterium]
MKKHFLVTISNDIENLFGVRFLCSFFNTIGEHQITLLHICRTDDNAMTNTLNQMWKGPNEGIEGLVTVQARKAIFKAKEMLYQQKMAIEHMMTKTVAERYGLVKDILGEGSRGLYDAIIFGRRAAYALQWMFERPADETVLSIIKDSACTTPLWICPEPESGRKNVLVCLDGSENSLRAVDHVGYILAGQEQHQITLLHAKGGTEGKTDELFLRAEALLLTHAISRERISRKTSWGLSVAGTIIGELEKGKYAAVAVGLRGERQEREKSTSLAGGTTAKLIGKLEKASLWCCP